MKVQDKLAKEIYLKKLRLIRDGVLINGNETRQEKQAIVERCKADPAFFAEFIFPHYATSRCAPFHPRLAKKVIRNKRCRILVRWGRGLAKSIWCNTIIPLWLWINQEKVFMVIIGNNNDKAEILLGDIMAEFEANPKLMHYFGEQFLQGSWEDGDFRTKDGRFIGKALGMGQSPLGLRRGGDRPNYISCDDLEDKDTARNPKRQDEITHWIANDVLPLMDGDTMRYVHPNNDPWARSIQNQLELLHPSWEVDLVEAYDEATFQPAWDDKYDEYYYQKWETDIGALAARAQFNHKHHTEGKIFTDELIQWAKPPRIDKFDLIVGHWDVAYSGKNDYNAVKVWGLKGRYFWHLKAFCKQCKMADAIRFMYEFESELPANVIVHWRVESQFWNDPVRDAISLVEKEMKRPLNLVKVDRSKANKYDRILTLHPYFQNGRIYYSYHERANNDMLVGISQLKGIEPGYRTHDDGPDADESSISELAAYIRTEAFEPRITAASDIHRFSNNRY